MKLIGVVAISSEGCIGCKGKIPWHYSEDFQHFKKLTLGGSIIMGRVTWENLPKKPLVDRSNVILTHQPPVSNTFDRTVFITLLPVLESYCSKLPTPHFVIGGAQIYTLLWDYTDTFVVTHVNKSIPNGDTFFPIERLQQEFIEESRATLCPDCEVVKYTRKG